MAKESPRRGVVNLGLIGLFLLFGLIVYLVRQGGKIEQIDIPGGGSVRFRADIAGPEKAQETSSSELEARQAELEQQVARLQQDLSSRGNAAKRAVEPVVQPAAAVPSPPRGIGTDSPVNLTGNWQGTQGFYAFTVNQFGSTLTFQWFEPMRGLIAGGQGQLQDQTVELSYSTVFGTRGVARLQVLGDGRELAGEFHDLDSGFSGQLVLALQ
jgi:hypothetical protein